MNIQDAIDIIESIAGVTDESTPAGEAWDVILKYICNPAPQPLVNCKAVASPIELRSTVMGLGQMGMFVAAQRVERAAELLQHQHPQPVAVSERPWEKEAGWRDLDGECWWCPPDGPPYWSFANPAMVYGGWVLPANALPTPQGKP